MNDVKNIKRNHPQSDYNRNQTFCRTIQRETNILSQTD